jgi:AcrR family transcriptional regulator
MKDPVNTRKTLLEAAYQVVHLKGFNAASLNDILAQTDLTKGALYHHFPNKTALGLALLDAIEDRIRDSWIKPLKLCADPIECLKEISCKMIVSLSTEEVDMGCPLNNLAQEMSSIDENFRAKVSSIYEMWCEGIERAIARGQEKGIITSKVKSKDVALFYISSMAGSRGLAKNARSPEILQSCLDGVLFYLEALKV